MVAKCLAPGCGNPLPEYGGRGRPRRWCSTRCRRLSEVMAEHYRRGTLGVMADQSRSLGLPEHGAQLDAWQSLYERFEKTRR